MAALTILALGLTQTGCVTSKKYKLAKPDSPAAKVLDWKVTVSPADLTLTTLVVFKGPGSWKREARWDEYSIRVSNHGDQPLLIADATLIDLLGQPQIPGVDPWKLEKQSSTNWEKYGSTGLQLLAGAGLVAVYAGLSISVALGEMFGGTAAATGGAAVALTAIPIFAVVDLTSVAVINHNNKKKVVAEFDRRRLVLPLTIAPGATAEGSLFFPMTPGPQRLVLNGKVGTNPLEIGLELKPLAGLHLKPKDEAVK